MLEEKYSSKFELAYSLYLEISKIQPKTKSDCSYLSRALGQLIYNKFGKEIIGISKEAEKELKESLTEDHFNNCQNVGEYLLKTPTLKRDEFEKLIVESRKTIIVTKKENSFLRKFQKSKTFGYGLEAYKEAQIEINFYSKLKS